MDKIRHGIREYGDGETAVEWWLIPRDLLTMTDAELCYALDIGHGHPGIVAPGASYRNPPSIRRTTTRALITQWGGWNV